MGTQNVVMALENVVMGPENAVMRGERAAMRPGSGVRAAVASPMRTKPLAVIVPGLVLLGLAPLVAGCSSGPDEHGVAIQVGPSPTLAAVDAMDPEARDIAERVIGFAGGAEAIDNVQTLEVRFEGETDGNPLVFHLAWSRGGSRSGAAWYGMRMGPISGRMGTDGTHYWRAMEGEGPEMFEIDPEEGFGWQEDADQVVAFASFPLRVINPTNSHSSGGTPLRSAGSGEFKGQRSAVLEPGDASELEVVGALHVEPDTGRPLGSTSGLPGEPLFMTFSDWREVDGAHGLKMFHRVKVDGFWLGDEVFDLKAKFVRVNTLDEADFAPPADAVLQK